MRAWRFATISLWT